MRLKRFRSCALPNFFDTVMPSLVRELLLGRVSTMIQHPAWRLKSYAMRWYWRRVSSLADLGKEKLTLSQVPCAHDGDDD